MIKDLNSADNGIATAHQSPRSQSTANNLLFAYS